PERVYLDAGGREGSDARTEALARRWSAAFTRDARRLRDELLHAGLHEGVDLRFVEVPEAIHHESEWARRLPDALRFLFGPPAAADRHNVGEGRATAPSTRGAR
ncbi:MAG TPA: hypothetical protein VFX65_00405, partial [Candidatus Limnocylindrales bacterium]|nr:hypothetical protein [Candidatus Limnocylindrales bacterium]